jgi:hypothetical protein
LWPGLWDQDDHIIKKNLIFNKSNVEGW